MSEQGIDWKHMSRADFDPDAPLQLDVSGGQAAVPAVPDEYGTAPLFGDETPIRSTGRTDRRPAAPVDQDGLF